MAFHLGGSAREWNRIATVDRRAFSEVRRIANEMLLCETIGITDSSEFKVLAAIAARTLRFRKFAEAISVDVLMSGLKDDAGDHVAANDRVIFAGTGIRSADTIRKAVVGLEEKGLITRWPSRRSRWSTTYMPFSEDWLAREVVIAGGVLPRSYRGFVESERVRHVSGDMVIIRRDAGNGRATVERLSENMYETGIEFDCDMAELERLDVDAFLALGSGRR